MNDIGKTPLIVLCYHMKPDCDTRAINILIEKGCKLNIKDKDGVTALLYSCGRNNIPIIETLIDAKADVNISVESNFNPLRLVCLGE